MESDDYVPQFSQLLESSGAGLDVVSLADYNAAGGSAVVDPSVDPFIPPTPIPPYLQQQNVEHLRRSIDSTCYSMPGMSPYVDYSGVGPSGLRPSAPNADFFQANFSFSQHQSVQSQDAPVSVGKGSKKKQPKSSGGKIPAKTKSSKQQAAPRPMEQQMAPRYPGAMYNCGRPSTPYPSPLSHQQPNVEQQNMGTFSSLRSAPIGQNYRENYPEFTPQSTDANFMVRPQYSSQQQYDQKYPTVQQYGGRGVHPQLTNQQLPQGRPEQSNDPHNTYAYQMSKGQSNFYPMPQQGLMDAGRPMSQAPTAGAYDNSQTSGMSQQQQASRERYYQQPQVQPAPGPYQGSQQQYGNFLYQQQQDSAYFRGPPQQQYYPQQQGMGVPQGSFEQQAYNQQPFPSSSVPVPNWADETQMQKDKNAAFSRTAYGTRDGNQSGSWSQQATTFMPQYAGNVQQKSTAGTVPQQLAFVDPQVLANNRPNTLAQNMTPAGSSQRQYMPVQDSPKISVSMQSMSPHFALKSGLASTSMAASGQSMMTYSMPADLASTQQQNYQQHGQQHPSRGTPSLSVVMPSDHLGPAVQVNIQPNSQPTTLITLYQLPPSSQAISHQQQHQPLVSAGSAYQQNAVVSAQNLIPQEPVPRMTGGFAPPAAVPRMSAPPTASISKSLKINTSYPYNSESGSTSTLTVLPRALNSAACSSISPISSVVQSIFHGPNSVSTAESNPAPVNKRKMAKNDKKSAVVAPPPFVDAKPQKRRRNGSKKVAATVPPVSGPQTAAVQLPTSGVKKAKRSPPKKICEFAKYSESIFESVIRGVSDGLAVTVLEPSAVNPSKSDSTAIFEVSALSVKSLMDDLIENVEATIEQNEKTAFSCVLNYAETVTVSEPPVEPSSSKQNSTFEDGPTKIWLDADFAVENKFGSSDAIEPEVRLLVQSKICEIEAAEEKPKRRSPAKKKVAPPSEIKKITKYARTPRMRKKKKKLKDYEISDDEGKTSMGKNRSADCSLRSQLDESQFEQTNDALEDSALNAASDARRSSRVTKRKKYNEDWDLDEDAENDAIDVAKFQSAKCRERKDPAAALFFIENPKEEEGAIVDKVLASRLIKKELHVELGADKIDEPQVEDIEEFCVKYKNFSHLHCEWKTVEELEKGDKKVAGKIKRFKQKQMNTMFIEEFDDDQPFHPDFITVERVLDVSVALNESKPGSSASNPEKEPANGKSQGTTPDVESSTKNTENSERKFDDASKQGTTPDDESESSKNANKPDDGFNDIHAQAATPEERAKLDEKMTENGDFVESVEKCAMAATQDPVQTHYLVKWRALPYEECTWELESDVDSSKIKAFEARKIPPLLDSKEKCKPRPDDWKKVPEDRKYKNGNELREYQLEGVNWLLFCWCNRQNCILADEMGLGKTVQSVTYLLEIKNLSGLRGPFLIIAPLSTIINWQREFESWSDFNAIVYHGSAASRRMIQEYDMFYKNDQGEKMTNIFKFDAMITTYEMVMLERELLKDLPWRVLIIDEAHRLKNRNCKLMTGLSQLKVDHRVLLTGTPLQNNIEELFALLNFLEPKQFCNSQMFLEEFGTLQSDDQVQQLQEILKPMMLRRLKEDVEKSLKPKEETIIEVELTNIQKKYYRAILERNFSYLSRGSSVPSLMNTMMELRKCCNHPFLINGAEEQILLELRCNSANSKEAPLSEDQAYYHGMIQSSGKVVLIDKLLPRLKSSGHKVLVFSQMVRCLDILEDYLMYKKYPFERIDGNVRGDLRQAAIDRFSKPDSDRFVFLLCTRAGGLGINLTAADTVIIFDSDWNPQNDLQAQARCHRIGQEKFVKVYRLICRNSYEREMFDKASLKLGLDKAVLQSMGTKERANPQLTKKEIEELLRKGAYGALMDENNEGDAFCEEDIDQILQQRAHTVTVQAGLKGSTFAKASFAVSGNRSDIDVNDPNFWQKWARKANIDVESKAESHLILFEPRQRKRRFAAQSPSSSKFHQTDDMDDDDDDDSTSLAGVGASGDPDDRRLSDSGDSRDSDSTHRGRRRFGCKRRGNAAAARRSPRGAGGRFWDSDATPSSVSATVDAILNDVTSGLKKKSSAMQVASSTADELAFMKGDYLRVEKYLSIFGWGRWRDILKQCRFKRNVTESDAEFMCRTVLLHCVRQYSGDLRVKTFIWDLITPPEFQKAAEQKSQQCSDNEETAIDSSSLKPHSPRPSEENLARLSPPKQQKFGGDLMDLYHQGWAASPAYNPPVLAVDYSYERHLQRHANNEIDLKLPWLPEPCCPWWSRSADKSLLIGAFKHGLENFDETRNDKTLCFLTLCPIVENSQQLNADSSKMSPRLSDIAKDSENEGLVVNATEAEEAEKQPELENKITADVDKNVQQLATCQNRPFPSASELNARLRKIIALHQRMSTKNVLYPNVNDQMSKFAKKRLIQQNLVEERELKKLEEKQQWSRREEAEFYRALVAFGLERDPETGELTWDRFREMSKLKCKSDLTLTEYFISFEAMCKRICRKSLTPAEECLSKSAESLSEERAMRVMQRVDFMNRIRALLQPAKIHLVEDRMKLAQSSDDMPDWWQAGSHDLDLMKGVARHGLWKTEENIVLDPQFAFKDILVSLQKECNGGRAMTRNLSRLTSSESTPDPNKSCKNESSGTDTKDSSADQVIADVLADQNSLATSLFTIDNLMHWPKERTIVFRLQNLCYLAEEGHWPAANKNSFSATEHASMDYGLTTDAEAKFTADSRIATPSGETKQRGVGRPSTSKRSDLCSAPFASLSGKAADAQASVYRTSAATSEFPAVKRIDGRTTAGRRGRRGGGGVGSSAAIATSRSSVHNVNPLQDLVEGEKERMRSLMHQSFLQQLEHLPANFSLPPLPQSLSNALAESLASKGGAQVASMKPRPPTVRESLAKLGRQKVETTPSGSQAVEQALNLSTKQKSSDDDASTEDSKKEKKFCDQQSLENLGFNNLSADSRIPLINLRDGSRLSGKEAPMLRNLAQFLFENQHYMIDMVAKPALMGLSIANMVESSELEPGEIVRHTTSKSKPQAAAQNLATSNAKQDGACQPPKSASIQEPPAAFTTVTVVNRKNGLRLSGSKAPQLRNLNLWLEKNPDWDVDLADLASILQASPANCTSPAVKEDRHDKKSHVAKESKYLPVHSADYCKKPPSAQHMPPSSSAWNQFDSSLSAPFDPWSSLLAYGLGAAAADPSSAYQMTSLLPFLNPAAAFSLMSAAAAASSLSNPFFGACSSSFPFSQTSTVDAVKPSPSSKPSTSSSYGFDGRKSASGTIPPKITEKSKAPALSHKSSTTTGPSKSVPTKMTSAVYKGVDGKSSKPPVAASFDFGQLSAAAAEQLAAAAALASLNPPSSAAATSALGAGSIFGGAAGSTSALSSGSSFFDAAPQSFFGAGASAALNPNFAALAQLQALMGLQSFENSPSLLFDTQPQASAKSTTAAPPRFQTAAGAPKNPAVEKPSAPGVDVGEKNVGGRKLNALADKLASSKSKTTADQSSSSKDL